MGIINSTFCAVLLCIERVATWMFCAILLILLMMMLVILMIYGITVGYHYAQKELAAFAMEARITTTPIPNETSPTTTPAANPRARDFPDTTEIMPLEVFRRNKPTDTMLEDALDTPDVEVEIERERPTIMPKIAWREQARLRRHKRARNTTNAKNIYSYYRTEEPFLRPLTFRHRTNLTTYLAT